MIYKKKFLNHAEVRQGFNVHGSYEEVAVERGVDLDSTAGVDLPEMSKPRLEIR